VVLTSGGAHGRMLQPWMGSAGLSMDFSFFYLINRGRDFNHLGKDLFTVTL
jgi:hypothetical protein